MAPAVSRAVWPCKEQRDEAGHAFQTLGEAVRHGSSPCCSVRGRGRATHPARPASFREAGLLAVFLLMGCGASTGLPEPKSNLWQGLSVAPEARCAPYNRDDYRYPASVEAEIIAAMGGRIYGPYTGRYFGSPAETDIEHIVAVSEAHDSGMCARSAEDRWAFARDLLNLTLAAPDVNRHDKAAKDVAEWLPPYNRCWYVGRTLEVRRKWRLTIDRRELDEAIRVLDDCPSTAMLFAAAASHHEFALLLQIPRNALAPHENGPSSLPADTAA